VNIPRYRRLLTRAVDTILESVIEMDKMQNQLAFDFVLPLSKQPKFGIRKLL
jgi:hypothetical protein